MNAAPPHYLVYDGACALCVRLGRAIQQADRRHRLEAVTFADPLAARLLASLPPQAWRNTFHVVAPDGRLHSGDAALPVLVRLLPCGRPLAWLMQVPIGGRAFSGWMYRRLTAERARSVQGRSA